MPTDEWREANKDRMRQYRRDWYYRNREASIEKAYAQRRIQRQTAKEYVNALKADPCTDCGGQFPPVAMQFDHLRDKEYGIAAMVSNGLPVHRIQAEIAKCELVCANCHAIRTQKRRT